MRQLTPIIKTALASGNSPKYLINPIGSAIMSLSIFRHVAFATTMISTVVGATAIGASTLVYAQSDLPETVTLSSQSQSQSQSQNLSSSSLQALSLIEQAKQLNLANHPTWLRLHYYDSDTHRSEVENAGFFISDNGKENPEAELEAFINAMTQPNSGSDSVMCRFPARTHWVQTQLGINDMHPTPCPEFDAWMQELDPQRLSVVFAEEYLDNPLSAFGHTLMLIDSAESLSNPEAINYAHALNDTVAGDDDAFVVYAVKSMLGEYPNEITIDPYQEKLAYYLKDDERDVWVYPINLTQDEVTQIIRHVWETKDLALPYYFTKDNCASEILRYIDIVRPDGSLLDEFNFAVIPSSVVRLLHSKQLISEPQYLPADDTLRQAEINNSLITTNETVNTTSVNRTELSNTLSNTSSNISSDTLSSTSPSIISPNDTLIPTHNNPVDGHELQQARIGIGQQDDTDYARLSYRYGFHDLLDNPDGYPANFDMQTLSVAVRIYEETDNASDNHTRHDDVEIESLTLIKGRSFNPINTAHQGNSWGINLGAEQVQDGSIQTRDQSHLVANLGYERGVSMAFGAPLQGSGQLPPHLCYALGNGTAQVGKGLGNGYRVGVAANLGCRYQINSRARLTTELSLPYWYHGDLNSAGSQDGYWQPILSLGAQYDIDKSQAVRIQGSYQFEDRINDQDDIQLAYVRYF